MYPEPDAEIFRLRTALRDLVSVSTIPMAWLGREPSEIAGGVADVLIGSLGLDFVFVRLCDPTSGATIEVTRGDAWKAFPRWLQRHLASAGRLSGKEVIPEVGDGAQPCRGLLAPLGVNAEGGLVAAACHRIDFPAEIDQLLVSVAANHAATAFQSSRAEQDLRRARRELETKVAERTAELRRATAELQTILDASPVGIALFGRNQAIQRCNPAFERILGWKTDIAHRPVSLPETNPSFEGFLQHIHPEDRTGVIEALDRATREKTDFEMDLRAVHLDGTMRYLRGIGHPVFNASGDVVEYVGTVTDLTERRQQDDERERLLANERTALAEAVAAQQRFRDLVNSVEGIVWEADVPRFQFSFVSKTAERILGYPVERWLTEPTFWKDHLHPDDRDSALQFCQDGVSCKRDHDFEYRMIAADGRAVWLRDLVTVVVEGDRATRVRGVMVDITERKQAEQERQAHLWFLESMDRVNRAIQGTNDLEQMMSDVLDAVLSIFNCDRAWLVYPCDPEASSWGVPMEHTRPEFPGAFALRSGVPMDPDVAVLLRTVRACSGPVRFGPGSEHPLPAEVARRFSVQSQISMAVYPKGDRAYMFGLHQCSYPRVWTPQEERLFQEIGRRLADALTTLFMFRNLQGSEARLEQAQRIAHIGYWDCDLDTDRITWSDEAYRIFGLPPQEHPITVSELEERTHPEDREIRARAVAEAARGGPRYDADYRIMRPNGEVRFVHSQGDVTKDASGRPRRVFGTIQDITERKRTQDSLREAQSELAHLARVATVGELAASLAHELSQPLAAINTNASACLRWLGHDQPDLDEVTDAVRRIIRDGKRAGEVIVHTRALLKKSGGKRSPFDLADAFREVVALVQPELSRHRIVLHQFLDEDLPSLLGARVQLQQVVLNLIMNAIDAMSDMSDRSRELMIRAQRHDCDGREGVLVAVQDTGTGLAQENLEKVFHPFYTTKEHGLGMGLSICQSIIEAHGGRLWATPNAGPGATFEFVVPASLES
jgi:PAS domain S-box-containing protein